MERVRGIVTADDYQIGVMNSTFCDTVAHKYRMQCIRLAEPETLEGFARYLLTRDIIRQRTAARYMVYEYYPKALYDHDGRKKPACVEVSIQTGICESTIWNMMTRPSMFQERGVLFG